MTRTQDNIIGALVFALAAVTILCTVWVSREAISVVSATRVAHQETREALQVAWDAHHETLVDLAECRKQVNKSTSQLTNEVQNVE